MNKSHTILFAKPHICKSDELISLVDRRLDMLDIQIIKQYRTPLTGDLLYQNYLPHAFYAYNPFTDHLSHLNKHSINEIEKYSGQKIESLLNDELLLSAKEAVDKLGINPIDLYKVWLRPSTILKLQVGYQLKEMQFNSDKNYWITNGYFPYRFELYSDYSETIPVWLLALPDGLSVEMARIYLLGDLDASENTLRGYISRHHIRLGIHMDAFNNGFHMSDCESASIREIALWFPDWLKNQPIIRQIGGDQKIPVNELVSILSGLEASFSLAENDNIYQIKKIVENTLSTCL